MQGLLERCAQCTAGAGALATGASLGITRVAALPVPTEAHRIKLPGLCHHQAWWLCQAVCWVSTCHYATCYSVIVKHLVICHGHTVVIAGIRLLVAVRLMWLMMHHCHCNDTVPLSAQQLPLFSPRIVMSIICLHVLASASISCVSAEQSP